MIVLNTEQTSLNALFSPSEAEKGSCSTMAKRPILDKPSKLNNVSMKKWLNVFFIVFFILCLGIVIGTICFIVNCCTGNTEIMYHGELENSEILIKKDLGNATMADYLSVYINGQRVYDEKFHYNRDGYVEKVVLEEDTLFVIFNDSVHLYVPRDTISVYIGQKE